MKRFTAIILFILLVLLTSCRSTKEFLSDFNEVLDNEISKTYSDVNDIISSAVSKVVKGNSIDKTEVVKITPIDITDKNSSLGAYKKLNSHQKKLYSIMLLAIKNMVLKNIEVTKYVDENGFSDTIVAHRAIICDRPDMFWMPKTVSFLSLEGKPDKYIAFRDYYAQKDEKGFYSVSKTQKEVMKPKFDTAVNKALSGINGFDNKFEIELYLHDYLCENVTYDSQAAEDLSNIEPNLLTAYGALVEGKAVCEGYSKAMQLLCIKCGIPCSIVFGEHEGVSHMWNIVNPGDGLYYVDTTFDDSSSAQPLHIYFNVTKDFISKDRKFDDALIQNKKYEGHESFNFFSEDCKNTFLNYFEVKQAYIDYDCAKAIDHILAEAENGKKSTELKNSTDLSSKKAFDLLCLKARGTISLRYCYRYDNKNIIVAVW